VEWFWWDWSISQWPTGFLRCLDAVGWVIWGVKIVPKMTYKVSSGTLNLCSLTCCCMEVCRHLSQRQRYTWIWTRGQRNLAKAALSPPTLVIEGSGPPALHVKAVWRTDTLRGARIIHCNSPHLCIQCSRLTLTDVVAVATQYWSMLADVGWMLRWMARWSFGHNQRDVVQRINCIDNGWAEVTVT